MAGEDVGGSVIDGDDSLDEWVDAKAEELGVSRRRLLERLGGDVDASAIEEEFLALAREFDDRLDATRDDLESEVDAAREEFDGKIDDVRDRVIQVKRETDEKAPGDHDHPDLRERADDVADRTDRLGEELASVSASVEDLESTVEVGFDNYEDVLEFLTEATDDLDAKLRTLAEVTVALREQTKTLAARHAARSAADELAHLANRRGVERAKCGRCGESVHVGLLAAPRCPHCASTFSDVEPKRGFFGSARLVVGDQPALEGEQAEWAVGSVTDAESVDPEGALDELLDDGESE